MSIKSSCLRWKLPKVVGWSTRLDFITIQRKALVLFSPLRSLSVYYRYYSGKSAVLQRLLALTKQQSQARQLATWTHPIIRTEWDWNSSRRCLTSVWDKTGILSEISLQYFFTIPMKTWAGDCDKQRRIALMFTWATCSSGCWWRGARNCLNGFHYGNSDSCQVNEPRLQFCAFLSSSNYCWWVAEIFTFFIDCHKAFNRVSHNDPIETLSNYGVDDKDIRFLRLTY